MERGEGVVTVRYTVDEAERRVSLIMPSDFARLSTEQVERLVLEAVELRSQWEGRGYRVGYGPRA